MRILILALFLLHMHAIPLVAALRNTTSETKPFKKHYPFVIFSPPKCGTHLVGKTLSLMVNEKPAYYLSGIGSDGSVLDSLNTVAFEEGRGNFLVAHHFTNTLLKTLVRKGYKILFVVRDPRDQVISVANWLREGQWHWLPVSKISDFPQLITELITGEKLGWKSVEKCFLSFENELTGIPLECVYKVHFENLVGPHGQGTLQDQYEEILGIANCLGMAISNDEIAYVAKNIFGGTKTFRDGSIGKWKHTFTPEQKEQFRQRYNYLLFRLGYETSVHWQ